MSRFIVPVVVLVALVGGYVVGQPTPFAEPGTPVVPPWQKEGEPLYKAVLDLAPTEGNLRTVGRYVPFGNDRLLDTTDGTLYRMAGDAWVAVVKMPPQQAAVLKDTQPVEEPQYEIFDDPDAKSADPK